ncbi:PIG-L family deacetylase [Mycobacterium sp. MS1601]|uniref:PIG-L deacetylase family protein n=1 Tax=Mycobacterium sp. MS1601 TaxID=1936029 RepID=UPI000979063D|nr:PIG-L family deacetylase [Mycobacterium sp. MS1601]AQA01914.1 PIG-L family deacetylase [Mycobacterium sp. MS1601]
MTFTSPRDISSIAVVGAHCDDIAIGAGATLLTLTRDNPDIVVHALVLTGAGTEREVEEKSALAAVCGGADVRLTVADFPDGRLPQHWAEVKSRLADFRRSCEPDLVIGPQRHDAHQDHRLLAELMPTEFRGHQYWGYEILKWESDLPTPNVFVPATAEVAELKQRLLHECYPSQTGKPWFDSEAFLGLMRIRGVQCRHRYAEGFVADKIVVTLS